MEINKLQKLGFTFNEAKIYLILVEYGPLQAGMISKKTQINRRTTYDTIERLIKMGYLSYNLITNKKIFKATNPNIILDKIKETEEQAKELIPELKQLYKKTKEEYKANLYKGRKGIRVILNDILKQKQYVVFGSNEKFPEIMKHDFDIFQKKKKKLNIKSKTIMSISMKGKPILKKALTTYEFIPAEFSLPTSTFIYGNKIAMIIWLEVPIGMLIENKEATNSFKQYFDVLWKTAKP